MMQTRGIGVFQNFIAHIPEWIYEILIHCNILDGLKFPGTGAGIEESYSFIQLIQRLHCKVDNHGWNGITAQLHDSHFGDKIEQ